MTEPARYLHEHVALLTIATRLRDDRGAADQRYVDAGKLTAEEVITRASTKGVLSEAQKAAIRAAAQPKPAPAPEPEPETEVIDAPEQKAQADDDGWLQDYEATEAQQ